jgi:hypothetical protein
MFDADLNERVLVATVTISITKTFNAVFNDDVEMYRYRQDLAVALATAIDSGFGGDALHGAKSDVSIPSYAVGTLAQLVESGDLPCAVCSN